MSGMDLFEYVDRADIHQLLDLGEAIHHELVVRDTVRMEALEDARRRRIAQTLPLGASVIVFAEHDECLWAAEVEAIVHPPRGPLVDVFFSAHAPSFFLSVEGAFDALRDGWRLEVQVGATGYRLKPPGDY